MDALFHSNRMPEPHEATIISAMMNAERDSIHTLDTRIHKLEQDAEMTRQHIQQLTAQLEAENRGLRLHEDMIMELQNARSASQQSIERKQAIMSSSRRIPREVWRMIFLLLWESEFMQRKKSRRPVAVALQVGAVCREWRNLAQTTTKLWSILDYTFSSREAIKSHRDDKLYHYLDRIGAATPYITLRRARFLLLPAALCQVTTATELTIRLNHVDIQVGLRLTFPLSTPSFSHLCTLFISSDGHVLRVMSDFLRPFPFLKHLCLTDIEIHWLEHTVPHINLKTLTIKGTMWPHPLANVTIDIAVIAKWFPNLVHLTLECDLRISMPHVVLHHVRKLCIRSGAVTSIHDLTSRVSFPNLNEITNRSKSIEHFIPMVRAWGRRAEKLELVVVDPNDGSDRYLSEMLDDKDMLPRLSTLAFLNTPSSGVTDLAPVVAAVVRRNDLAANGPGQLKRIETVILPITYNSDPNLERLKQHVAVEWQ